MIGFPHHIERLPDHLRRRRRLIEGISSKHDMAGYMVLREGRKSWQYLNSCLPQTNPHVFGKATKGFSQMKVRGMNESDHSCGLAHDF